MKGDSIVVGVDIGSSKVAVVVAEASTSSRNHSLEVLGFSEVRFRDEDEAMLNGAVLNPELVGHAVSDALDKALQFSPDLEIGSVNISFGGTHVKVAEITDSTIRASSGYSESVTQQDIDQLITYIHDSVKSEANREIMHILPKDFIMDSGTRVKRPVGRKSVKLGGDFVVVSADSSAIQNSRESIAYADPDLEIDKTLLSAIAAGLAVLDDEEKKAGIALVDIGEYTTDIVIYHNNIVKYIASLPLAGYHITSDIKYGCELQLENAEKLKRQYGSGLAENVPFDQEILVNYLTRQQPKRILRKNVALIIEERLKEIAAVVYAEIKKSGYLHELIGGVVLTGGTANLTDIETVFSRVFGKVNIRVGIPEGLEYNPKADFVTNTSYATALGLAWAGVKPIDARVTPADSAKPVKIRPNSPGGIVAKPTPGVRHPMREVKRSQDAAPVPPAQPVKSTSERIWDMLRGGNNKGDESNPAGDY